MKDGFISVACGSPDLRLADCHYNAGQTFTIMRAAEKAGVKVLVLPELGLYLWGPVLPGDVAPGRGGGPGHRAGGYPESGSGDCGGFTGAGK